MHEEGGNANGFIEEFYRYSGILTIVSLHLFAIWLTSLGKCDVNWKGYNKYEIPIKCNEVETQGNYWFQDNKPWRPFNNYYISVKYCDVNKI
jgi:hypothetical protein